MDVREKTTSKKRLIDADNLVPDICDAEIEYGTKPVHFSANAIDLAPTVDAVPVVRCRECKHCDPENYHCDHHMSTAAPLRRKPDDFCSYGERKEGADNEP